MGKLDWHKRYHDKALGGMMGLSLDERGAYNTALDLIYAHDDQLADDDRFIAGWCQCDVRVWKRIKASLISKGKLYVEGGLLRNFRATSETLVGLSRVGSASEAGKLSGISRRLKSKTPDSQNNDLARTTVQTTVATAVPNQNQNDRREESESKNHEWDGVRRFVPLPDSVTKRKKPQSAADQDMVKHLMGHARMTWSEANDYVAAGRSGDVQVQRDLERISRAHSLGWFAEEVA